MIVDTLSGPVRGREHDGVVEFLGIPYARAARFAPPSAPEPWSTPRDATRHGPVAPQLRARLTAVVGASPEEGLVQGEDCLRVDVRAPAGPAPGGALRPVLVWVHGGAYVIGSGATAWYDTARLVREGDVVTVNVGYRLGVLGWLRLPGVSPGNLGLLDVLAALRWVRENVRAFGGDPERVTAAGQSAGAHTIASLLTVADARPLIGRAVLQSGQLGLGFCTERRAARVARFVVDGLDGADPTTASLEALLRAQKHAMIEAAGPGGMNSSPAFAPVAGVAPLAPGASWADTAASGRDLIVGSTRDEATTFVAISPGLDRLRRTRVLGRTVDAGARVATRRIFTDPALRLADDAARAGAQVRSYSFDWHAPRSGLGACHCIELPFLFGTKQAWRDAPMLAGASWDDEIAPLGDTVRAAWLAFVRGDEPARAGALEWPAHVPGAGPGIRFDGAGPPRPGRTPDGTGTLGASVRRRKPMALMRRVATLGAVIAAVRSYARQNPEKVNRYADRAAEFVNTKTAGKYRRQVEGALRQVRKETTVPGRPTMPGAGAGGTYRAPNPQTPNDRNQGGYYPSSRADRP